MNFRTGIQMCSWIDFFYSPRLATALTLLAVAVLLAGDPPTSVAAEATASKPREVTAAKAKPKAVKRRLKVKKLFDGKTLKGWKVPNFGGQGEVYVKNGAIVMEMGDAMTGGFQAPSTAAQLHRFACDDGGSITVAFAVLIQYPRHHLGVGANIWREDVVMNTEDGRHLLSKTFGELLSFRLI